MERRTGDSTMAGRSVGLDVTPMLGPGTGIGTYTRHLVDELAMVEGGPRLVATAFTARGTRRLRESLPADVELSRVRAPARLLRQSWAHSRVPPVEALCGRVDVFHGTNFVAPPTRRAASVVTIHDLAYLRYPETVDTQSLAYRELVPRALDRGAIVCTPSQTVAAEVRSQYDLDADRVVVTRLGVDPGWFQAEDAGADVLARHDIPNEFIVAVGTLEPRKNLDGLLAAYRLAAGRAVGLPPLVLIGSAGWGPSLNLDGLAAGQVILPGHLPLDVLRQVVSRAQLLVFPSLYEGFGLPPLEALASGVPVVAADIPVTREVLGAHAVFADPRSAEALLEAIERTLGRAPGDSSARRDHAATFTWSECARATLRAYSRALER